MIGPKKFGRKEKLMIVSEALELEKILADTLPKAQALCEERDEATEEYEMKIKEYLFNEGVRERVKICIEEKPFSQFSPQIKFKDIIGADVVDEDKRKGIGIESILSEGQVAHLKRMGGRYRIKMAEFNSRFSRVYIEQEDAYNALLEKTMVEMTFTQDMLKEKVILYVADPVLDSLKRAKIDLRTGRTVSGLQTVDVPNSFPLSWRLVRQMKKEANDANANVYVVQNPSKVITATDSFYHVKRQLQEVYDGLHPALAHARLERDLSEEQKDLLEVVAVLKQDAIQKKITFVSRKFGWLHPSQEVSADVMEELDLLMDANQKYRN